MKEKGSGWWQAVKLALGLLVLAFVGRQFSLDMARLEPDRPAVGVGWLALAGLLYLVGMGFSGLYWVRLIRHLGASPGWLASARAYYVSQLGKYVPGKALALILRVGMVASPATPASTAALAAFHEVLATMASGAVVAVGCSLLLPVGGGMDWGAISSTEGRHDPGRWEYLGVALGLMVLTLVPILPPVFNRLAAVVTRPFRTGPLPEVGWASLGEGLLVTAPCWLCLGAALGCGLLAVGATLPPAAYLVASMAIAYVAGFVVPISPGGLGVRELALSLLLARHLDAGRVALAVLLLRLAWTLAEGVAAGILYPLPVRAGRPEGQP